ncbi:MAG: peptidylprolyl isomerase [Clostridia bacterium]|nr:peptidylprolyl isomerase [Clostridia bacterium]
MRKILGSVLVICCFIFLLAGCSAEPQNTVGTFTDGNPEGTVPATETPVEIPTETTPETIEEDETVNITITMQDGGVMKLELYPDKAPATVSNFVKLAKEGFYNGLTFHRIMEGFMIQGGDPQGTGFGGSDENIPGEFAINGFAQNDISHLRGVISMARAQSYNSASSQFFIVHADSTFLDGQYAAFGMLTEGFDVLDRLAATPVGADGQTPLAKPVIESITVQ